MNHTPIETLEAVLHAHLQRARTGSEDEFLRSYRDDSFLITPQGVQRDLEAIRVCYRRLKADLANASYTYKVCLVEEDVGFLEWSADSARTRTPCRTARTRT